MRASVFGLGYVGAVTAGCLAHSGHDVIGADVQQAKVDALNAGVSPIVEPELDRLLYRAKRDGHLRATTDVAEAVLGSDASIICVGTPSLESGRLSLSFVRTVSEQIRGVLAASGKKHVLFFRSTMLPGSTRAVTGEFFQDLKTAGQVWIYYYPEFLREGTAVKDFREPSLVVIGTHDSGSRRRPMKRSTFWAACRRCLAGRVQR